ncbi:hypothetical protein VTL71DRAFT_9766 [Oculimacula yallundae]|uniref:DUF8004 domain-containing protein n=1 Tax=Oculimacula yallundae TaxID=86028 RepID=A0ABR4BRT7_9HELO
MAFLLSSPPSKRNRLSKYLPGMLYTETKNTEDNQTVLRKPMPAESAVQTPPSRAPPSVPFQFSNTNEDTPPPPPPHASNPHKLQKQTTTPISMTSPRDTSPSPHSLEERRPRADSLLLPPAEIAQPRSFSTPISASRPVSTNMSDEESNNKIKKRRSWLPSSRSKSRSRHPSQDLASSPAAWISAGGNKIEYSLSFLLAGDKIPELWDDSPEANMYVYLYPEGSGHGPQIKCHSLVAQCSQPLLDIIYDNAKPGASGSSRPNGRPRGRSFEGRANLNTDDATRNFAIRGPTTPPYDTPDNVSPTSGESVPSLADVPRDVHLYYPVELLSSGPFAEQDIQNLVDARNLFAFFNGQPLVSTPINSSYLQIFMAISAALAKFMFSNQDGTSFGESADAALNFYLDDLKLADIRGSSEKIVEGLVISEQMRCTALYIEAFAHAVGKFVSIKSLQTYNLLSETTRLQIQQSRRDLTKQQNIASQRLNDFVYPSLWSGVANSTSSAESKIVRFKNWKLSYISMRKHVLHFYKKRYNHWPPKAGNEDIALHEGGLNRLVMKLLYADFCALYDYLVDRSALTTRGVQESEDRESGHDVSPTAAALRKLLGEFDRSSPPVQPPIPYDTPLVPMIQTVEPQYPKLSPKDQHKLQIRSLKEYEMRLLLTKSHNVEMHSNNEFVQMYLDFEAKEARGKNALELSEMRYGHWIFLYAVIQSLPMLVTDAPTLKYTDSVEYFLCQMPANPKPWIEDSGRVNRNWYNTAGGGLVNLPSHMVESSVEAVYNRSHCWKVAEQFMGGNDSTLLHSETLSDGLMSPLQPPPGFGDGELRPPSRGRQRSSSNASLGDGLGQSGQAPSRRASRQAQRRSIALGLELLSDFPGSEADRPGSNSRPISRGSIPGMSPAMSRGTSPTGQRRAVSRSGDMMGMGGQPQSGGSGGASTFDDILGSMKLGPEEGEKKKKKMGFF